MSTHFECIRPSWPHSLSVGALTTTRRGGVSKPPFSSLNLAAHVGDDATCVKRNRALLAKKVGCLHPIAWVDQIHSNTVIKLDEPIEHTNEINLPIEGVGVADALYTGLIGQPLGIMTADCLPILMMSESQAAVAAIHAGWRGLVGGVIENTISCFPKVTNDIVAWLGPAIGPLHYVVGEDVIDSFMSLTNDFKRCFQRINRSSNKARLDLNVAAKIILNNNGVTKIHGQDFCTFSDDRFYSYRREGVTGRTATVIWNISF